MSRENVELVESLFSAWNRQGIESFLAHAAEDIEWLEVEGRPDRRDGSETRGREALREGLGSLFDAWEEYRLEPQQVYEVDDDRVVAVLREVARGRESGIEVDGTWGYVITLHGGQLKRVEAYRDPADALAAAGLAD